jgi:hypothetical protein
LNGKVWLGVVRLAEKADLAKLLAALRDSLSSAVKAIDAYLQALEPEQASVEIRRNGGVYGRLLVKPDEIVATPAVGLNIEVAGLAIQRFLIPKVLEGVKRKYGVDYAIESEGGILKAVRLRGKLEQSEVERLTKAFAWAFEKAVAKQQ